MTKAEHLIERDKVIAIYRRDQFGFGLAIAQVAHRDSICSSNRLPIGRAARQSCNRYMFHTERRNTHVH